MKSKLRKIIESIYIYLMFLFLYVPIVVLMVFSFNDNKSRGAWGGFSLKWYKEMFANEELMSALQTTLIVGVIAAVISTIIGTAAAIGIMGFKNKKLRNIIIEIVYSKVQHTSQGCAGFVKINLIVSVNHRASSPHL